jgi:hypothetical protein
VAGSWVLILFPVILKSRLRFLRSKCFLWLFCGIVALIVPAGMEAQRRGGRGGGSKNPTSGGGDTESPEAKQFERAAAIQARPEQVTLFQEMAKTDQTARKNAQDLLDHAATADQTDLFHYAKSITVAVDEAQAENAQFMQSLSDAQKSGLKEFTRKLSKANSDVTKESKSLSRRLDSRKVNGKQLSEVVNRLDKALADFQAKQVEMGTEMGVPGVS